ncbi:MAG: type II and III secretion system protein [Planctomycetota bacterium]|nr:type II and III secretion system protein [Planctomycetota bacterium]
MRALILALCSVLWAPELQAAEADAAPKAAAGQAVEAPQPTLKPRDPFDDEAFLRNADGTVTWFYLTNHVGSSNLKKALDNLKLTWLRTAVRERRRVIINYVWDAKKSRSTPNPPTEQTGPDENLLILNFPPEFYEVVDLYLERFDTPVPQVYIKAMVVEVTLDSSLEYGVSAFFDKQPATGSNPNTFFQAFRSQFRPSSFTGPFLSPTNTGIGLSFGGFPMEEGTLALEIEALQERGLANILSEPSIVAMQGQLATIITGQETPIQDIQLVGVASTVVTRFKDTGIRLDFTPLHIGREFVKLRVRPEVSSITGFVEVQSGEVTTQTPIIAQRNAETVVIIRDGMTLVIGGLYATSNINTKSQVPLLGDIPGLGVLFSRTRKSKVRTELSFFITPHILRQRLDQAVFAPPMEKLRLAKAKEEKKKRRE